MNSIQKDKRRFNRIKRRLELGQGKPDDRELLTKLGKRLNYRLKGYDY